MPLGPFRSDDREPTRSDGGWGSDLRDPAQEHRALETPEDRHRLEVRVRTLEIGLLTLVALLLLGFWHLQVVHGAYYSALATDNQLRQTRIRPARGLVLDRNGAVLATNRPSYEVALIREAVEDEETALEWLAATLEEPLPVLRARLESQRALPRFRPVILAAGVDQRKVIAIEARRREFPGVDVRVTSQRYYPQGTTAAHVLGHVGEVSPRQLEAWGERYRMGDIVGQQGIERIYNDDLAGEAGMKLAVVNSVGREVEVLEEDPPEPGETVVLTLDLDLQQAAEELLRERRGAIVAIDVRTGGVLALASSPAFDPNAFAARFSSEEWQALQGDPALPLSNRAVQAALPPGSVFKLVMAIAGLEEGVIGPGTTFFCPGGKTLYGHFFRCLGQHGSVNVVEAIAASCNSFFYELGVKLGRERIVAWAQRLGYGDVTGLDVPDEQGGLLPSDEWLQRTGRRYYAGDTVSISIGQGLLSVSPLQVAHMAAILGSGLVREPHVLARVEDSSGAAGTRRFDPTTRTVEFSERSRELVLRGMAASVARGTSRRAALADVAVGGKTGTAQVVSADRVAAEDEDRPERLRNHAWFVGLAPIDRPEIAVAVFLEHGGSGGREAAPLGQQLLGRYFGPADEAITWAEIPVSGTGVEAIR